ncbi:MAG TPA: phosphatase PAP2 family protein [Steroidobacteraceae bacterium]|nr:phosphatase PAP2 family protein [Steroidobacteraceae bacterium]
MIVLLLTRVPACFAGGGPLGIDHEWSYDDSGIWKRSYQQVLEYGLLGADVAAAMWEGGETRLGRTMWKSLDATAASGVMALAMKYAFSRVRPIDSNNDPNLWFKGHGNQSFPSGEVTEVSAIVTPFVLEYGRDHPGIYALELLPVYDGIARMKVQAHWQTDVLAGFALGTGTAWLVQRSPSSPFILRFMPHGVYVGIGKSW